MLRTIIALLIFLTGALPAIGQTAPPKKAAAGLKTVGVITAIGDTFTIQKVGFTVFGNEQHQAAIGAWGLDEAVVAKVGTILGKSYNVKRIAVAKNAFAQYYNPPPTLFRDSTAELRDMVRKIAAGQPCDLYVVVRQGGSRYGDTNQAVTGVGIVQADRSPLFVLTHLHALMVISVHDGKTFAALSEKAASIGQPTFMTTIRGPNRELDQSWWPASPQQAAQSTRLRDAARSLVEQGLTMTLPEVLKVN